VGYDVALFFHICGVLTLFVAIALELTTLVRLRGSRSVAEARTWTRLSPPPPAFIVAVIVIIGAGLYMLHSNYGSAQPWAMTALTLVVALSVLGAAFNGPHMQAIHRGLERAPDGPIPGDVQQRIFDPWLLMAIQTMTVMIVGIVLLMTVKPGLRDSLIIAAVAGLVGLATSQLALRSRRTPAGLGAGSEPEYAGAMRQES
jgi:hypothetical protein